ncbi:hypothetical protein NS228_13605 [Methylobacterium indicum]|uniref:HTH luxR-type domain-containing protein n=1 Tax=Methylobacterium indicum TaxID=1775910 RepID=A0ABR5HG67_9HYPH|nr:hypothetical protein QR78_29870 [Methylobacterium indicum]KMO25479.1 hypothetical protein QR79_07315 [Methylobacterium indicum]KTS38019.1 hypothetical protein NS229_04920 [Methylobacterium indicum]KTS39877.1 hypothetical protein NS228_13605 [Methylobacterium indicum]KTS54650.1 hypothetical protein NS230_00850 [Methylobacterium indicum]
MIDGRALERECLALRLAMAGFRVICLSSVEAWRQTEDRPAVALVLLYCDRTIEERRRMLDGLHQVGATQVIVISPVGSLKSMMATIEHGARGYVPTASTVSQVVAAMRLVLSGEVYIPPNCLFGAKDPEIARPPDACWQDNFTAKQVAVIEGIRMGKPNKIIAYELNMCESTVKVHIRNVMKKLNARNRTELAFKATEMAATG